MVAPPFSRGYFSHGDYLANLGEEIVELTLLLNDEMSNEILEATRDCRSESPLQFVQEALESCLASRRLLRFGNTPGGYGGRHLGKARQVAEAPLVLVEHDFLFPDREM